MKTKQITVVLGCVIKDNKILLVKRDEPECHDAHMKWEIPGGKVDFGESIEEALIREILEETGVRSKIQRLLPVIQTIYWDYKWGVQQTICICYECKYVGEKTVTRDHHVAETMWTHLKEVKRLDTLQGVKEFIKIL